MKEYPITFNTAMVNALTAGIKTQSRRIVKANDAIYSERKKGDKFWVREAWQINTWDNPSDQGIIYRASENGKLWEKNSTDFVWRPPVSMPKKYSRLKLEIDSVRMERIQDISEQDARKEGFTGCTEFEEFWYRIYPEQAWDSNLYVWVINFHVIENLG